jgi:hypothetical protein
MDIRRVSPQQAASSALEALGLGNAEVDLVEPEGLAESLRRAASFLCPATRSRIIRAVSDALAGLPGSADLRGADLEGMLASLIGYGDLLELPPGTPGPGRRLVFLGPPAFVRRRSGACLVMGVRPDGAALLSGELAGLISYESHTRIIRPAGPEAISDQLTGADLPELTEGQWLQSPPPAPAEQVADSYKRRVDAARPAGEIAGLQIIDPAAPVTNYRRRWRSPVKSDGGYYVGRRPQQYGAGLWCFAALSGGMPQRIVDLPLEISAAPAADEAWRLQAALDALTGRPQQFRVTSGSQPGTVVLDFLSPLPSWAQRRLDVIGTPLIWRPGALFSYSIPHAEAAEEHRFLATMMWMSADEPARGNDHA